MQKAEIGLPYTEIAMHSESGTVGAAWVQYRAFPHELRSEHCSRTCRVIPLQICGVFAPKKCTVKAVNAGGTAEGMPFVPNVGMRGLFFCS